MTGIIGSGVVVHLPSFFKEFDALQAQGQLRYVTYPTKLDSAHAYRFFFFLKTKKLLTQD